MKFNEEGPEEYINWLRVDSEDIGRAVMKHLENTLYSGFNSLRKLVERETQPHMLDKTEWWIMIPREAAIQYMKRADEDWHAASDFIAGIKYAEGKHKTELEEAKRKKERKKNVKRE